MQKLYEIHTLNEIIKMSLHAALTEKIFAKYFDY